MSQCKILYFIRMATLVIESAEQKPMYYPTDNPDLKETESFTQHSNPIKLELKHLRPPFNVPTTTITPYVCHQLGHLHSDPPIPDREFTMLKYKTNRPGRPKYVPGTAKRLLIPREPLKLPSYYINSNATTPTEAIYNPEGLYNFRLSPLEIYCDVENMLKMRAKEYIEILSKDNKHGLKACEYLQECLKIFTVIKRDGKGNVKPATITNCHASANGMHFVVLDLFMQIARFCKYLRLLDEKAGHKDAVYKLIVEKSNSTEVRITQFEKVLANFNAYNRDEAVKDNWPIPSVPLTFPINHCFYLVYPQINYVINILTTLAGMWMEADASQYPTQICTVTTKLTSSDGIWPLLNNVTFKYNSTATDFYHAISYSVNSQTLTTAHIKNGPVGYAKSIYDMYTH